LFDRIKIPKRLITSIIVVLVLIIAVYVAIKVAFGSQHDVKFSKDGINFSDPAPAISAIPNDAELTTVEENSRFRLEYSPSEDLLVVTDLKTGVSFRSWPEATEEEVEYYEKNKNVLQILKSIVFVEYTKSGQEGGTILGINQVPHTKEANKIDGGLQIFYNMTETGIRFAIEFYIHEDGLEVLIPKNGIEETHETAKLASLYVLPYFDSARQEDYGYFVAPDGSGALTRFDANRITNYDSYNKKIYGDDMTFNRLINPDYKSWPITMPVFGIVKENSMITCYIKEGDANASLFIEYPGNKNLPLYSIGFYFRYRQFYLTKLSKGSADYELLEENMTLGDVRQKFYIETTDEAESFSYVDVANKTRELLFETWKTKYGIERKLADNAKSMNVRIFMGDENRWGGALDTLKVMTTFDEVIEMYEELKAKGVEDIRLSIAGWQKDGYYGNVTKKFNPDKDFGGKKGFEKLTSWAKENNVEVSFDNNLLLVYGRPKASVPLRSSVVKKPGVHYLQFQSTTSSGVYRRGSDNYVLSPLYYEKKVMAKEIQKLKQMGAAHLDLQQLGDNLFTDYNRYTALLRSQLADKYVKWLKEYTEEFDTISIYYGNSYAVSTADKILNIPTVRSANMVFDETVPFIQIVYHGIIDYYSNPLNNEDDPRFALLRSLEYGAFPSYELTYRPTGDLKYTNYNRLFNSQFSLLIQDVVETYNISEEVLKPLRGEFIVNHYRVPDDGGKYEVYVTEYSNGTKIYVNYGKIGYIIPDTTTTVDAMGYAVVTA